MNIAESIELKRLQKQISRLERIVLILILFLPVCVCCVLMMGATQNKAAGVLDVKQILVHADDGRVVAAIGCDPLEDAPYMHLFTKDDRVATAIGLPGFTVNNLSMDKRITTSNQISITRRGDGTASILFRDDEGRSRLQLGLGKDQTPAIALWDKRGTLRTQFALDAKTDEPMALIGKADSSKIVISTNKEGVAGIDFFGKDGILIESNHPKSKEK